MIIEAKLTGSDIRPDADPDAVGQYRGSQYKNYYSRPEEVFLPGLNTLARARELPGAT